MQLLLLPLFYAIVDICYKRPHNWLWQDFSSLHLSDADLRFNVKWFKLAIDILLAGICDYKKLNNMHLTFLFLILSI